MKIKSYTKRITTLALSLIVIVGLMPTTVFADGTYTFPSLSQSGNNNSILRYYLTDENAGSITVNQFNNHPALYLNIDDGWYFEKWDTYFNGYEDRPILSDPVVEGSNPVSDEGYYTFFNISQKQPFSNTSFLYIATATNFYGDHKVTAVLKPIVTVNAGDGVEYQVITNYPSYADLEANQVAVKYEDNATITYTVDNKYVVTSVSANYGTNYSDNGSVVTVNSIVKPVTITINTKLKQEVKFNANGGTGAMDAQYIPQGVNAVLNANTFTRTGYAFNGWNTVADGTGTVYTDKQTINTSYDITLYAQWVKLPADVPQFTITSDIEDTYQSERTISVVVDKKSGYTYSYQWYQNSANTTMGGTAIDGATTDGYRLPVNTPVGTHYYYCVVTATRNDNGETASQTSRIVTVKLKPITMDGTMVTLSTNMFTYNGQEQKPTISVSYYGLPLTENIDYTITWPIDCKNVGDHKPVTITFKGNYSGTVEKTFDIKPKESDISWSDTELTYPDADSPSSSQTGDNSNLWLWVALLFISGGLLFMLVLNMDGTKEQNLS